jgi:hypothetical protein
MNTLDLPGLTSVRPADALDYLRHSGWRQLGAKNDVAKFEREADVKARVEVLLDTSYADYKRRLAELVDVLSVAEKRPASQVLSDLLAPPADNIRFRVEAESVANGLIPLDESIRYREAFKQLLLSSAHSAIEPRPYFARLSFFRATEFVKECREGNPERGSYVANVMIPVPPMLVSTATAAPNGDEADAPYARRVSFKLVDAVVAATEFAATGAHESLLQSSERGISANFLSALGELRPHSEMGSLEVSTTWSRSRPAPKIPKSRVRIDQSFFPTFSAAAKTLRERSPTKGVAIEGLVIRLEQQGGPGKPGEVVILATLESLEGSREARIRVGLDAKGYAAAVDAHRHGHDVRITGTLQKEGRSLWLRDTSDLEVIPGEPD